MRVLGVDPGLARTGIALVDGVPGRLSLVHAACLETAPQTSDAARFVNLMDLVLDALFGGKEAADFQRSTWRP